MSRLNGEAVAHLLGDPSGFDTTTATIDPMTDTIEAQPEIALLLGIIDAALVEVSARSLMDATQMADLLLDIRAVALTIR